MLVVVTKEQTGAYHQLEDGSLTVIVQRARQPMQVVAPLVAVGARVVAVTHILVATEVQGFDLAYLVRLEATLREPRSHTLGKPAPGVCIVPPVRIVFWSLGFQRFSFKLSNCTL